MFLVRSDIPMLYPDDKVRFEARHRRQDVIQNLLCCGSKLASSRADFDPTFGVSEITLGCVLRVNKMA